MDYLTYKGKKLPIRVSYYALKKYQEETGQGIESIDKEITNLEILLHYSIIAGAKAEDVKVDVKREDMEFILDEALTDFNGILTSAFPDPGKATKGTSKKK